ncbi:MAG: hypothetical protein D6797_06335 [Bdellovibrio sp.]|nr:MAG: hypothetical protein D6797_06335 [Bdellovibrio sp.]
MVITALLQEHGTVAGAIGTLAQEAAQAQHVITCKTTHALTQDFALLADALTHAILQQQETGQ